jgi:hypothetical protein
MNVFAHIILFIGCVFATAAILMFDRKWIAMYLAFTAILCVGTVAMVAAAETEREVINPTTRAAISAFYVANDNAQKGIDADICGRDVWHELSNEDLRQIKHVKAALQAAYDSVNGSDMMLDIVTDDFCFAAGER